MPRVVVGRNLFLLVTVKCKRKFNLKCFLCFLCINMETYNGQTCIITQTVMQISKYNNFIT